MIRFVEDTHQYFDDDKELISVTTLMAKHGLGVNYDGVDKERMEASAKRGRLIHKAIEDFIKNGEISFMKEVVEFSAELQKRGWAAKDCEFMLYNDVCAGTSDLLLETADGELAIADNKTTNGLHKDAVSWQLSIYNALMGYKCTKAYAFHFQQDDDLRVVEIEFKPKEEIERLFECERKGEQYKPMEVATAQQLEVLEKTSQVIANAEAMIRAAKKQMASIKDQILEQMEKYGVKSYENDYMRLTRKAGYDRQAIDSDKLKAKYPDIYDECLKLTAVAPSLSIILKDQKEDNNG